MPLDTYVWCPMSSDLDYFLVGHHQWLHTCWNIKISTPECSEPFMASTLSYGTINGAYLFLVCIAFFLFGNKRASNSSIITFNVKKKHLKFTKKDTLKCYLSECVYIQHQFQLPVKWDHMLKCHLPKNSTNSCSNPTYLELKKYQ